MKTGKLSVVTILVLVMALAAAPVSAAKIDQKKYANLIIVAESGGDFTSIQAAIDSVTCSGMQYLISVKPGTYDENVWLKECTDIIGSGQENTRIEYSGNGVSLTWPTGADGAVVEHLTVAASAASWRAIMLNASAIIRHVTVIPPVSGNYGIDSSGPSVDLELTDSKIVSVGGYGTGIYGVSVGGGNVLIKDCVISLDLVEGGWGVGVLSDGVVVDNAIVTITAPDGGSYGILGNDNVVLNSKVSVASTGPGGYGNEGVSGSNVRIQGSEIIASPDPSYTYGVIGSNITVNNSVVSGSSLGISGNFKIGNSQIIGGHDGTAGSDKVVNCHDGNFNPIPNL